MAFARSGLQRGFGANSGAGALWMYSSTDAVATVTGADYFLPAINELNIGDCVIVIDSDAPGITITFVKTNTGTAIDCASGTALGDV